MDPTGEECKATQDKNKIIKWKLMRSTYIFLDLLNINFMVSTYTSIFYTR